MVKASIRRGWPFSRAWHLLLEFAHPSFKLCKDEEIHYCPPVTHERYHNQHDTEALHSTLIAGQWKSSSAQKNLNDKFVSHLFYCVNWSTPSVMLLICSKKYINTVFLEQIYFTAGNGRRVKRQTICDHAAFREAVVYTISLYNMIYIIRARQTSPDRFGGCRMQCQTSMKSSTMLSGHPTFCWRCCPDHEEGTLSMNFDDEAENCAC